jgi:hypothetical protein
MRIIMNTGREALYPWPSDLFVQGGSSGIVVCKDRPAYKTAFVEAFPTGSFLRGEGETVAEAEQKCWEQFLKYLFCDNPRDKYVYFDNPHELHGPYERRHYTNGAGYCTKCGTWMVQVFEPLPDDPNREPTIIEQLLTTLTEKEV